MANNKMLIDASHPEETRVVVMRGNRIEEFDFEAQERRQLRGNIYLAKVTRVEPSLQAAFIDYGGNRHGFLAFSEIHPDYYQIPAADRQALLDEVAQDAKQDAAQDAADDESETDSDASLENDESKVETAEKADDAEQSEEKPKKRRRRTRRKPKAEKAELDANSDSQDTPSDDNSSDSETAANTAEEANADSTDSSNEDDGGSTSMAAMVEMDSISEPAPEDDNADTDSNDDEASSEDAPKPKKRRTTRKKKVVKAEEEAEITAEAKEETSSDDGATEDAAKEEAPKKRKRLTSRKKKSDEDADASNETTSEVSSEESADATSQASQEPSEETSEEALGEKEAAAQKPKRRSRRSRGKSKVSEVETDENGAPVENLGSEDALEEVPTRRKSLRQYKIQEVIRRRQVLLVQVVKEERGNKGAALTTYLSLAGRYSVLMPNTARGGGISRKITNPSDRKRLKEIAGGLDVPAGMGVILRTAGASRTDQEITRDFEYLMRLWENVRSLTLESTAPYLVYEEGNLIKRSIRDLYSKEIGEVIVSGEEAYKEAKQFMQMLEPNQAKNVKLYRNEAPILTRYGVESQLDKMLATQVTLKSGGYLVINQTEALVAVDVNSGKSTREHSIEATAVQTNLEAAEEVARQLRLRDLAGLVVIDFIDMEEKRNNRAVEKRMKDCLKSDRARIQVGHISHFGLMEMSRQRIRASVLESTMEVCPNCDGVGYVRSPSSYSIHIMRALEEHLNRHSRNDVTVKVARNAALYMLNHQRSALSELEDRYGVKIIIEIDASIDGQTHKIEKGPASTREPKRKPVVNPMDVADDHIVDGSEPEQPVLDNSNQNDRDGDDEESGNKKRRRRRRGGRGRGRDKDQNQDNAENTSQDGEATSAQTSNESVKSDAGSDKDVSSDQDVDKSAPVQAETAEVEEAPKKRSRGRRKKAPIVEDTSSEQSEAASSEPKTTAVEPPKKPRRATGRPGKKAVVEADDSSAESDESVPSEADTEAVIAASSADVSAKEEAPKKPRRKTGRPGAKKKAEAENTSKENTQDSASKSDETSEAVSETSEDDVPKKPKRRTSRRKKKEPEAEQNAESTSDTSADQSDDASQEADGDKKKKGIFGGFFS